MYYSKRFKLIAIFCLAIIIIGGGFALIHFKKKKVVEVDTPNIVEIATPTPVAVTTPQTQVTETPTKTTPSKPVLPPLPEGTDQFVVSLSVTADDIASSLQDKGYIQDAPSFVNLIGTKIIAPGAYKISNVMTPSQLLQVLTGKPYMKWVVIPPGLRKEEIAALLASTLGWTKKQMTEWITKDTATKPEYIEGVYTPNTYLIPVAEAPTDVAARLISKFNEGFSYYLSGFTAKNIKWTTALTFASIVQREAANVSDMPLIAGILWNRLNQGMMLDVDSTLQYIRGDAGNGWWAPITVADKSIDSPYNTYKHTGLPPHPISNPSFEAINAVLNPTTTDCLYYLHDRNHITHCAVTYGEHLLNITLYLKTTIN